MADPTKYKPHFNYSGWEAAGNKRPKPGAELDNDFANIARSIDETIDALKDIRRSDGKLKNGIVDKDALDASSVELWESADLAAENAKGSAQSAAGSAASAGKSAEAARGYASDAVSQGNVPIYASVETVKGLNLNPNLTALRTNGYNAPGDGGGALYKRVASEPSHNSKVQSADGSWWEPVVPFGYVFDSVSDMQASRLVTPGARVRTLGYYSPGDGGGNDYEIVASGTGADDGGSFIDLSGSGLQAKGLFNGIVNVKAFGAVGDGVADDGPSITSASAFAASSGATLIFERAEAYLFSQIVFANDCRVLTRGAHLRAVGGLSGLTTRDITIGDGCQLDMLHATRPATGENEHFVYIGQRVRIEGDLRIESDSQWHKNGVLTSGEQVSINGTFYSKNIDRAFDALGQEFSADPSVPSKNMYIGRLHIVSYRRGIYVSRVYDWEVGSFFMEKRSPNVAEGGGQGSNGFLIAGCSRWRVGDGHGYDSASTFFRIGGASHGGVTEDFSIGNLFVKRSGRCALKINANVNGEKVRRGRIASVTGVDIGDGPSANNQEIFRCSHFSDITVGSLAGYISSANRAAQWMVMLNDGDNLQIGQVVGQTQSGLRISQDADADGVDILAGPVTNVHIGSFHVDVVSGNVIDINMADFGVGNIWINDLKASGFSSNLGYIQGALPLLGPVVIEGSVDGSTPPRISNAPDSDLFLMDVTWGMARYTGKVSGLDFNTSAVSSLAMRAFNPGDERAKGLFLQAEDVESGIGLYGGSLEFSRLGSGRRGAAIAVRQGSSSSTTTGLAFFIGGTVGASDELRMAMLLTHNGSVDLSLPGEGVIFTSPDGLTRKKLTINNDGEPVWSTP